MDYIGVRTQSQRLTEAGLKLQEQPGIEATYKFGGDSTYLLAYADSERAVLNGVESVDGAVRVVGVTDESEIREESLTQIQTAPESRTQQANQNGTDSQLVEEWRDATKVRIVKGPYEGQRGQLRGVHKAKGELIIRMNHPLIRARLRFEPEYVERVS